MMLPTPRRREIDHRTIKLLVGVIAITMPLLTSLFSSTPLASICASYHEGGWSESIFVGYLFAIATFLMAYNGYSKCEMVLSKIASGAALGIALLPCHCGAHTELVPNAHAIAALMMFLILAFFCLEFRGRALEKKHPQGELRASIYVLCGTVIILAIAVLTIDAIGGGMLSATVPRLTFYREAAALLAFGASWLTASRVIPLITRPEERFSPLKDAPPD